MKLCPEGIILTPWGRHLHGTCIPPGCTYPESFVSLRPFFRTLCPVSIELLRVHAAARGTCHVARGATWQTPSSFRRFGASFGVCRVQIGPAVPELFTKVLGQTDWLTDWQTNRPGRVAKIHPTQRKSPFIRMDYVHSSSLRFWTRGHMFRAIKFCFSLVSFLCNFV